MSGSEIIVKKREVMSPRLIIEKAQIITESGEDFGGLFRYVDHVCYFDSEYCDGSAPVEFFERPLSHQFKDKQMPKLSCDTSFMMRGDPSGMTILNRPIAPEISSVFFTCRDLYLKADLKPPFFDIENLFRGAKLEIDVSGKRIGEVQLDDPKGWMPKFSMRYGDLISGRFIPRERMNLGASVRLMVIMNGDGLLPL